MMKRMRLHSLDIWRNAIRNPMDGWYWIDESALYQKGTKLNGELWNIDYLMSPISDSLSGSMIVLHNLYSTLLLNSWRLSFQFQGATCEQPIFPGSSWFHGGRQAFSHLPAWLTLRWDLLRSVPFRTLWHWKMWFWLLKAGAKSLKLWLVYVRTITKNVPCHLPGFPVHR